MKAYVSFFALLPLLAGFMIPAEVHGLGPVPVQRRFLTRVTGYSLLIMAQETDR
jgi:hypothetical protein